MLQATPKRSRTRIRRSPACSHATMPKEPLQKQKANRSLARTSLASKYVASLSESALIDRLIWHVTLEPVIHNLSMRSKCSPPSTNPHSNSLSTLSRLQIANGRACMRLISGLDCSPLSFRLWRLSCACSPTACAANDLSICAASLGPSVSLRFQAPRRHSLSLALLCLVVASPARPSC